MRKKIPIIVYHQIVPDEADLKDVPSGRRPYCSGLSEFARQINYLKNNSFIGLSISQVQNSDNRRTIGITFDDGFESDYRLVLPQLEECGFYATFYIVTASIGRTGYMTWQQIKALHSKGMEIGSHSMTHQCLLELERTALFHELTHSKTVLEDRLGVPIVSFSIPYGFANRYIIEVILEAGYKTVCTSKTTMTDPTVEPRIYGRFGIRRGDSMDTFRGIVEQRLSTLFKIYLKETCKDILKHSFGRKRWLFFRENYLRDKKL